MNISFPTPLTKELTIILIVKLILIISIKVMWFSNPDTTVEETLPHVLFGSEANNTLSSTRFIKQD